MVTPDLLLILCCKFIKKKIAQKVHYFYYINLPKSPGIPKADDSAALVTTGITLLMVTAAAGALEIEDDEAKEVGDVFHSMLGEISSITGLLVE